jgi:hypothetical protein
MTLDRYLRNFSTENSREVAAMSASCPHEELGIKSSHPILMRALPQPSPMRLADGPTSRPMLLNLRLTISIRDRSRKLMIWEIYLACRIGSWHSLFSFLRLEA